MTNPSAIKTQQAVANVEPAIRNLIEAFNRIGEATTQLAAKWRWLQSVMCVRCHTQPVNVDGVDPSLCTECERRTAVRATAALLAAMVVLSVAMILLGRIG